MVGFDYMDGKSYHDPTHNPSNHEPSQQLRTLFKKHSCPPVVIQRLVGSEIKENSDFANLSATEELLSAQLNTLADLLPLWTSNGIVQLREKGSILAVYKECKIRVTSLLTKQASASHDGTYSAIAVEPTTKENIIFAYENSAVGKILRLNDWNQPHGQLWDDADTRNTRDNRMPFYELQEVRKNNEKMQKTSGISTDDQGRLITGNKITFYVVIISIADARSRQEVHWMLCVFLDVLDMEKGLSYLNEFDIWVHRMNPTLQAYLHADRWARYDICNLARTKRLQYQTY